MQSNHRSPTTFSDFTPEYIATLAQQNAMTYMNEDDGDGRESSLYNNPKTDTKELYKVRLNVAGLQCEYYTADFTPLIYQNLPTATTSVSTHEDVQVSTRLQVQVFSIDLAYAIENLYVESRTNVTFNNIVGLKSVAFKGVKNVELEGDFSTFFRAYVPTNGEVNAFTILAPNLMLHLLADGGDYDFEFSGSKIYFYKTFAMIQQGTIPLKKADYNRMLSFGLESAALLARASRPAKVVDTTNVPEMWQLYGMSKGRTIFVVGTMIFSFFFMAACIVNPLLWPIGGIIVAIFFAKRHKLMTKREKLIKQWQAENSQH